MDDDDDDRALMELERLKTYPYLITGSVQSPRIWWPIVFVKTESIEARMGTHGMIIGTPTRPRQKTIRRLVLAATQEFATQWGTPVTILWSEDEFTECQPKRLRPI